MGLVRTAAPSDSPVSLTEAKLHLRQDGDDDDQLIISLLGAATELTQVKTGRQFVTASYELTLDEFPGNEIELPRPPLQAVTEITYVDGDGVTQILDPAEYSVNTTSEPGYVYQAYLKYWPTTRSQPNAVTIAFDVGYGDSPDDVPDSAKAAIKLLLGHLYENREAAIVGTSVNTVPLAYDSLIWSLKIVSLP